MPDPKSDPRTPPSDPTPIIEMLHPQPGKAHHMRSAPAVRVADAPLHFVSAVGPLPAGRNGELPDDIRAQTRMLLDNLDVQLAALGLGWHNVVKTIQQVVDIREADAIAVAFAERYGTAWTPASTLTQVDALPVSGSRVQLDVIVAG